MGFFSSGMNNVGLDGSFAFNCQIRFLCLADFEQERAV